MNYEKILIVDDSSTSRMIVKRCFEIAGYSEARYYEAENGLEAIGLLQETAVDLILTDLKMPKMDGHTLIKKLKIMDGVNQVPIVVVSSMGKDDVTDQLKSLGVKGIIRKPISPEKALQALGV